MSDIKIDNLIRSHRKTIGLQITSDAQLIVRAPHFTPEFLIQRLIKRKESWIKSKQDYFRERQNKIVVRKFVPGEEFLFLGQAYPLIVVDDLPKSVVFGSPIKTFGDDKINVLMISQVALGNAKDHIENWYKVQALAYISQRTEYYAQMVGLKYQSIKINSATTRWGSCGGKNTLNFTWRLIMAPARVVDYVIIHELMHLKQKNHSYKFWAEVAAMRPDYRQDERWLKKNGYLLAWHT